MGELSQVISTSALNVNNLNTQLKGKDWTKTKSSAICYLQATHYKYRDTASLNVKEQKMIYNINTAHKKTGVATLIEDKINSTTRNINRDKEDLFHYYK